MPRTWRSVSARGEGSAGGRACCDTGCYHGDLDRANRTTYIYVTYLVSAEIALLHACLFAFGFQATEGSRPEDPCEKVIEFASPGALDFQANPKVEISPTARAGLVVLARLLPE